MPVSKRRKPKGHLPPRVMPRFVLEPTRDLAQEVDEDILRWEKEMKGPARWAVPHPDPEDWHGVPEGWAIYGRCTTVDPAHDAVLIQRRAGDWLVLKHDTEPIRRSHVLMGHDTLTGLYEQARRGSPFVTGAPGGFDSRPYRVMADWMQAILVDLYDPTDPVEEAERMLVAMGSLSTVPPAASLRCP